MLDGIEVLSKVELTNAPNWCWVVALFTLVIIIIISAIYHKIAVNDLSGGIFVGAVIGFIVFILIISMGELIRKPNGKYEYKVTISDEVNFKDFNDKYKVTDHEGKIYTIVEKDTIK